MKTKQIILTTLLSLFVVSGLLAQDKYEFAVVRYVAMGKEYTIYYSDAAGLKTEKGKTVEYSYFDVSGVTKYLEKLSSEGWEVYSSGNIGTGYEIIYHLRKKKN